MSAELHNNPLISRHGAASGYELRLGAGGAACFLVTVDGEHIEVSGDAGAPLGRWRHVAGVYNAESRLLQVWSGLVCVDQTVVPAGELSAFDGPLDIGACCPVCRPLQPFPWRASHCDGAKVVALALHSCSLAQRATRIGPIGIALATSLGCDNRAGRSGRRRS